ncbi:MAG: type II toxin-antitoxin system VapC family toxin [Phycisphaerae bacterium]|nr:type II toxin-antitoxin system VapC family toxin [Phycisphaerae bacterium]
MIVADVNLIAYLLIDGPFTAAAQQAWDRDSDWIAPTVWHSELLNVLATSTRERHITIDTALNVWAHAPAYIRDAEVPPLKVLTLAINTRFATFDCYYLVLASELNLRVVTADKKLLKDFPHNTRSIEDFAAGK